MPEVKREFRTVVLSTKLTESQSKKAVTKCEKLEITISEYLFRLLKKDLDIK